MVDRYKLLVQKENVYNEDMLLIGNTVSGFSLQSDAEGDYVKYEDYVALAAQVEAQALDLSEHKRLHNELNEILHPDGNGPTAPSLCDLVSYVRSDIQALVAQVEALQKLLKLAQDEYIEVNSDGETDCVTPYDDYTLSPQHHLRELRAEVGRAGFVACLNFVCNNPDDWVSAADQYAERIRRGEVE